MPVYSTDNKSAVAKLLTPSLYQELSGRVRDAQGWSFAEAIKGKKTRILDLDSMYFHVIFAVRGDLHTSSPSPHLN